jgi:hypothetical protein
MAKNDHRVEITTRNGDKLTRHMTADEAAQCETLPFKETSNVAVTRVTRVTREDS